MKLKNLLIVFLFIILFMLGAQALEPVWFDGFIADNANILSNQTKTELNNALLELQKKTKADIAVVTLKSLDGESIDDTALKIARDYKIGDKKLNTGALMLVAPNDRKVRIEIGYGLEGIITDSHAGRILDNYVIPRFKKGDYELGILYGTLTLANDIAKSYGQTLSSSPVPERKFEPGYQTEPILTDLYNDNEIPLGIKIIFAFSLICLAYGIFMLIFIIILNILYFAALLIIPVINIFIKWFKGKPINEKRIAKKIEKLINRFGGHGTSGGWLSGFSHHSSSCRSSSHFGGGGGFGGGGSSRGW